MNFSGGNSGEREILSTKHADSSTLRQYLSTNRSPCFETESILFKANQGIARQQGMDLTIFSGENIGR